MMLVLVCSEYSVQHRFSKIPARQYPAIHSDILNSPHTLSDYMHVHIILPIIWCGPSLQGFSHHPSLAKEGGRTHTCKLDFNELQNRRECCHKTKQIFTLYCHHRCSIGHIAATFPITEAGFFTPNTIQL